MDKEYFEQQRNSVLAEQEQYLREHPDVAEWVKKKRIILRVVLLYWLIHFVMVTIVSQQMGMLTMGTIVKDTFALLFQLMWLFVFLNPQTGWRMSLIVYLWAMVNYVQLMTSIKDMMDIMLNVEQMLLVKVVIIMDIFVPFLLLIVALYLTAFPKHRLLSEQAEEMYGRTNQALRDMVR